MTAFTQPRDYARIKVVRSLDELVSTPSVNVVNALWWPRTLPGDFREVVEALGAGEGIVTVEEDILIGLRLSDAGEVARDVLLADQLMLRACDLQPNLDCVHGSLREEPEGLFHTDVHSWHIDISCVNRSALSGLPEGRIELPIQFLQSYYILL